MLQLFIPVFHIQLNSFQNYNYYALFLNDRKKHVKSVLRNLSQRLSQDFRSYLETTQTN